MCSEISRTFQAGFTQFVFKMTPDVTRSFTTTISTWLDAWEFNVISATTEPVTTPYAFASNVANVSARNGQTVTKINPFFTQQMCDDYVAYFIAKYGEPAKKITLKMTPNPYLELNDNCTVFDKYTYTDDVYGDTLDWGTGIHYDN